MRRQHDCYWCGHGRYGDVEIVECRGCITSYCHDCLAAHKCDKGESNGHFSFPDAKIDPKAKLS